MPYPRRLVSSLSELRSTERVDIWRNVAHLAPMNVKAAIRVLDTDGALAEGLSELGRLDPVMARLVAEGARPALRKREPGFHGLAWIVMGQQLSVASADAIWLIGPPRGRRLSPKTAARKSCQAADSDVYPRRSGIERSYSAGICRRSMAASSSSASAARKWNRCLTSRALMAVTPILLERSRLSRGVLYPVRRLARHAG